jgi:hypothetical protein
MSDLTDQDREDLVAYLDGELDEERARAVEAKIAVDAHYRAEMAALKQTWELLDHLPRAEPSGTFTHRTLERLALTRGAATGIMPAQRRGLVLALTWSAAVLAAAGVSFWVAGRWYPPEPPSVAGNRPAAEEVLKQHRHLIQHWPLYELVGDFATLQALSDPDLFGDEDTPRPEGMDRERLVAQAQAFLGLAASERQRLERFDDQVRQLPADAQARLLAAGRRYAVWLAQLPQADRQTIQDAADSKERLRRLRAVREQRWRADLPKAIREQLAKLQGKELADRLAVLRDEEQQRRRDWKVAAHFWEELLRKRPHKFPAPFRFEDLNPEEREYVKHVLRPRLDKAEWDRLSKAQGRWPRFPRLLVELADAHPPALLGPRGPTSRRDLSKSVQHFLEHKLQPLLTEEEKASLKKAEGRWPDFPETLQRLAKQHYLTVPWQTLPGPGWDKYRCQ